MSDVSFTVAFIGGIMSFFTPCILPLLPVYFGYLTGEAVSDLDTEKVNKKLLINAFSFVLGLTTLNILLGFGAKSISNVFTTNAGTLKIVGGVLVILFGLYFLFDIHIPFLEREKRFSMNNYAPTFIKSFLLGIAFNFGWTPCNGPIVFSILTLAVFKNDYLQAGFLMLIYSIGFSVMFLLSAFFAALFIKKVKNIYKYFRPIKVISGLLMILIGVLMIFDKLQYFNVL